MINEISIYLNSLLFRSYFFDGTVYFFANVLPFILFFLMIGFFIVKKRNIFSFCLTVFLAITSWGISEVLKEVFRSPRPFILIEDIYPLFMMTSHDSFPSGHAMAISSLSTLMYFQNKKFGYLFFVGALIMGIARVIAGVHFIHDILLGYFLGVFFAIVSYKYFEKLKNKTAKRED